MVSKTLKLKAFGLLANAGNSIKDDAKLAARVREILAEIRQEDEEHKALEAAKIQPPPLPKKDS